MEPFAANMEWIRIRAKERSEEFCRRHRGPVYRIALYMTGRDDLAEDVTQEVLLRGLKHQWDIEDPFAWLRRVAIRRSLTALRKHRLPDARPESRASDADTLSDLAVRQTLAKLSLEHRTVLALAVGEGLSYAEIADALEIPIGTVGSRVHAAKQAFRKRWEVPE